MCWDWPVSGPCWPAVSSLTGRSCGRLWSPRAWPAQGWRPLLCTYPSYRRQHWKTTNTEHFFYLIILSILVLFYKCFLNQNCYRSLHLSAVGLGVNYVYFTIMISKNRFTIDHWWQRALVYTSHTAYGSNDKNLRMQLALNLLHFDTIILQILMYCLLDKKPKYLQKDFFSSDWPIQHMQQTFMLITTILQF